MGGSSKGSNAALQQFLAASKGGAAASNAQPAIPTQRFRAFQPGHLGLLASQLDAGFGGGDAAQRGLLNDVHSSTNIPIVNGSVDMAKLRKKYGPKTSATSTNILGGLK